jgi:DNA-binding MarR family transcriptional regulator
VSTSTDTRSPAPAEDGDGDDQVDRAATAVVDLLSSFIRLTPRDMSLTTISALSTLNRTGPRRITDLAATEGVTQPSVTSLVSSLVQAGYVERRSDPADKRVVMVAITDAGSAYLRTRHAARVRILAEAVDKLSAEQEATLSAAIPVIERLRELVDEQRGLGQTQK